MPITARESLQHYVNVHGSQTAAAAKLRVSKQYIGQMLASQRPVSENILKKLGQKRVLPETDYLVVDKRRAYR